MWSDSLFVLILHFFLFHLSFCFNNRFRVWFNSQISHSLVLLQICNCSQGLSLDFEMIPVRIVLQDILILIYLILQHLLNILQSLFFKIDNMLREHSWDKRDCHFNWVFNYNLLDFFFLGFSSVSFPFSAAFLLLRRIWNLILFFDILLLMLAGSVVLHNISCEIGLFCWIHWFRQIFNGLQIPSFELFMIYKNKWNYPTAFDSYFLTILYFLFFWLIIIQNIELFNLLLSNGNSMDRRFESISRVFNRIWILLFRQSLKIIYSYCKYNGRYSFQLIQIKGETFVHTNICL